LPAAFIGTTGSSTIDIAMGSYRVNVSPDLFGAFMEDINFGGEGGIYNNENPQRGSTTQRTPDSWAAVAGSGVTAAPRLRRDPGDQRTDEVRKADDHLGRFRLGPRRISNAG